MKPDFSLDSIKYLYVRYVGPFLNMVLFFIKGCEIFIGKRCPFV